MSFEIWNNYLASGGQTAREIFLGHFGLNSIADLPGLETILVEVPEEAADVLEGQAGSLRSQVTQPADAPEGQAGSLRSQTTEATDASEGQAGSLRSQLDATEQGEG